MVAYAAFSKESRKKLGASHEAPQEIRVYGTPFEPRQDEGLGFDFFL
jgi:hypothetical protein